MIYAKRSLKIYPIISTPLSGIHVYMKHILHWFLFSKYGWNTEYEEYDELLRIKNDLYKFKNIIYVSVLLIYMSLHDTV